MEAWAKQSRKPDDAGPGRPGDFEDRLQTVPWSPPPHIEAVSPWTSPQPEDSDSRNTGTSSLSKGLPRGAVPASPQFRRVPPNAHAPQPRRGADRRVDRAVHTPTRRAVPRWVDVGDGGPVTDHWRDLQRSGRERDAGIGRAGHRWREHRGVRRHRGERRQCQLVGGGHDRGVFHLGNGQRHAVSRRSHQAHRLRSGPQRHAAHVVRDRWSDRERRAVRPLRMVSVEPVSGELLLQERRQQRRDRIAGVGSVHLLDRCERLARPDEPGHSRRDRFGMGSCPQTEQRDHLRRGLCQAPCWSDGGGRRSDLCISGRWFTLASRDHTERGVLGHERRSRPESALLAEPGRPGIQRRRHPGSWRHGPVGRRVHALRRQPQRPVHLPGLDVDRDRRFTDRHPDGILRLRQRPALRPGVARQQDLRRRRV